MAAAAFFFSLMSLLVKVAGQRLPSAEIVLVRSVISLVLSLAMLRRARVNPWGRRKGLLTFRGLAGFGGLLCFFYAIPRLPLAEVTVLQFTNPVFTALLAAPLLGERITRAVGGGLLVSLAGVVFIARPDVLFGGRAGLDITPVAVALLGAVFAAVAYVTVRKLRETEHPLVVVLYFPLISVPASLPFLGLGAVWPTPFEWMLLLGIGVLTQIAQVYLTRGLHAETAGRATSVSYLQILFAAVWGLLFFDEVPGAASLLGALLVVGGVVVVARGKR